jgi:hypothetical protein
MEGDKGEVAHFPSMYVLWAACIDGSFRDDPDALYLVKFADKRQIIKMGCVDSATAGKGQYNVRMNSVPGATGANLYFSESLNAGTAWTWQEMVDNLWEMLPTLPNAGGGLGPAPTLPYEPHGTPEGLRFIGQSPWAALSAVLARLDCAVRYHPLNDTASYVQIGATQPGLADAMKKHYLYLDDARILSSKAPIIPETIRVFFHRYNAHYGNTIDEKRTGSSSMAPVYSVDKLTDDGDVVIGIEGTVLPIWDDMSAIYDLDGNLTNETQLDLRAAERASSFVRSLTNPEGDRLRTVYSAAIADFLPGSELKEVAWYDVGDGPKTEIIRYPSMPDRPIDSQVGEWLGLGGRPGLAERLLPPDLGRATLTAFPRLLLGKLDAGLSVDGSVTVSIWRWNGSAWADTGVDVTAYDWVNIAVGSGKRVIIARFNDSERWIVIGAEC